VGYDTGIPDGFVTTASIDTVQFLRLNFKNISSVVGIQDFIALKNLYINQNTLINLDLTQNNALTNLECAYNLLVSLDLPQNTTLKNLSCFSNQITELDVSQNTNLTQLSCALNPVNCLNLKNGNNTNLTLLAGNSPNLSCTEVDDVIWATANCTAPSNIDTSSSFSNNCNNACSSTVGISEHGLSNFNIYPKPTLNQLNIETELVINKVRIFDIRGKTIRKINQSTNIVDVTDFPSGIYFIKVSTAENNITKMFMKQ
jgi:hypothetical protein